MNPATNILWAASGSDIAGQTERALRTLQGADPLAEVIVICPPGPTAGTLRRRLPHCGNGRGVASVRFSTAVDYAYELSSLPIRAQRPVTPQLLSAAVRQELKHRCPTELLDVRDHRSTLDALVQAAEQLRNVALAPDEMSVIAELSAGNRTRQALATVALAARRRVTNAGFRDEPTLLAAGTTAVADSGTTARRSPVVVVMSECVHPGQLPFLCRAGALGHAGDHRGFGARFR